MVICCRLLVHVPEVLFSRGDWRDSQKEDRHGLRGCKKCFEKKIHKATQEATGPKSHNQRLTGAVEKLSKEQLDEFQKQVGPSAHDKPTDKK